MMTADRGRRVLFLDVDGVLNNARILGYSADDDRVAFNGMPFSATSLRLVASVVHEFSLDIVLSSSWRGDWPMRLTHHIALEQALASVGLTISDTTPEHRDATFGTRGREIREWLAQHPEVETFVIVDDIDDMPDLARHLVQTDFEHGFTRRHLRRVRRLLQHTERTRLWKGWRR